ncbi:MAG: DUF481 domain-containing protein [Saprospirales bacterium]|nr:MAG: DUF481 domain-containing protein [Saprospirales bacterium]
MGAKSISVLTVLLAVLIASTEISAQILNIERYRLEQEEEKNFLMKATMGLSIYNRSAAEDSPVDLFGYNGRINAIYFSENHTYTAIGQIDYLKINENPFLNFGYVHIRGHFFSHNNSSFEAFTQASYDNFRGLDPRILLGGGLRQKVLSTDRALIYAGLGILYEWERWKHPQEKNIVETNLFKSTNYLSYRLSVNEFLDFNAIAYFQTGYDSEIKKLRNRLSGNFNLNSKISDRFSFTNTFDFSYDQRPIVPITKFIFNFRTGISYSW